MDKNLFHYAVITAAYWGFTITDGAIRMLVVLYFHLLGYSPFEVAMLFVFYEFFGIVTNLVGGWLAARLGLNMTLHLGMALQIVALAALMVPDAWLSVAYVMAAQALSGIAKDLNKMSAKASVKTLVAADDQSGLFRWVALLTGSKNALKGAGFFIGAALLEWLGFRGALGVLVALLSIILLVTLPILPRGIGKMASKPRFRQLFSNIPAINQLSLARFFLFGARDVWFVVGLPVFLYEVLGWSFVGVGSFMAAWVIGYGFVQASAPAMIGLRKGAGTVEASMARKLALPLMFCPLAIAYALNQNWDPNLTVVGGLILFAFLFALNSALHSFLILAYADHDKVALNVGFYYMANAAGRLAGTVLSGWMYQQYGLEGCLWVSTLFLLATFVVSLRLPEIRSLRTDAARE